MSSVCLQLSPMSPLELSNAQNAKALPDRLSLMEFSSLRLNAPLQSLIIFLVALPPPHPSILLLRRCKNRYLDFQRSQAITSDLQKIKIQEYIDPDAVADPSAEEDALDTVTVTPNVPRTFEAEFRGEELVDSCVSGDLVVLVGIVKAVQQVSFSCAPLWLTFHVT